MHLPEMPSNPEKEMGGVSHRHDPTRDHGIAEGRAGLQLGKNGDRKIAEAAFQGA